MTFQEFYAAYPRHIGRAAAEKAWSKLNPDATLQAKIEAALKWQAPMFARKDPKYVPHPATWLNQARWDDEPDTKQVAQDAPPQAGSEPRKPSACFRCRRTGTALSRLGKSWNYACKGGCDAQSQSARPEAAESDRLGIAQPEADPSRENRAGQESSGYREAKEQVGTVRR